MYIPVIGLITAIILVRGKGNVNLRNFGRASLFFQIIGIVIAIAAAIFVWITWAQIQELLTQIYK
jgi:uncharacterized membrane protein YccC